MSKFTLVCDNEGIINTLEFECETLTNVIENLEIFLLGCGYYLGDNSLNIEERKLPTDIDRIPDWLLTGDKRVKHN